MSANLKTPEEMTITELQSELFLLLEQHDITRQKIQILQQLRQKKINEALPPIPDESKAT